MSSKQKSSQKTGPSTQQEVISNALIGYYLGDAANQFLPGENAPLGTYFTGGGVPTSGVNQNVPNTVVGGIQDRGGLQGYPGAGTSIPGINALGAGGGGGGQQAQIPTGGGRTTPITAGSIPGTILPNYNDVLDISGETFFGGLAQGQEAGNINPIFGDALNNVFGSGREDILNRIGSATDSFSLTQGALGNLPTQFGPDLVTEGQAQEAVQGLLNAPSLFSDGPEGTAVANQVDARTQDFFDAQMARADDAIGELTERAMGDLAEQSGGLISSSQMLNARQQVASDVITEMEAVNSGMALENTKFLYESWLQDQALGTDRLRTVLQGALTEKGIDQAHAAAIADAQSRIAIASMQQRTGALADIYRTDVGAGVDLLNLGLQDFGATQDRRLDTLNAPIDNLIATMGGIPGVGTQKSSQKSI